MKYDDVQSLRAKSQLERSRREVIKVTNKQNKLTWDIDYIDIDAWKRSLLSVGVRFMMVDTRTNDLVFDSDTIAEQIITSGEQLVPRVHIVGRDSVETL